MLLLTNFLKIPALYVCTTVAHLLADQKDICVSSVSAVFSSVKWPAKDLSLAFTRLAGRNIKGCIAFLCIAHLLLYNQKSINIGYRAPMGVDF